MVFTVTASVALFKCHSPLITRHLLTIHIEIILRLRLIALYNHVLLSKRAFLFKEETELDGKPANGVRCAFSVECLDVCFMEHKGFSTVIHWPLFFPSFWILYFKSFGKTLGQGEIATSQGSCEHRTTRREGIPVGIFRLSVYRTHYVLDAKKFSCSTLRKFNL